MTWSIRKVFVLSLWIFVALLVASPIQGQESKKDKVKLTIDELKDFAKPGVIRFGITHGANIVWVIEALENGKQSLFWRNLSNPLRWFTDIGTTKIVGNQTCAKWTFGPEKCFDIYRVGEDKYEYWFGGSLYSTCFRGQREYGGTKKDIVKRSGDELKERESQYSIFAGINHNANTVWIMERPSSGKRVVYWRSLMKPSLSGSDTGTAKIVDGKLCTKYSWGQEKCYEIYRISDEKNESRLYGGVDSTFYQLK